MHLTGPARIIDASLNRAAEGLRVVEDFIRFLRRDRVGVRLYEEGFLHAKCYLFYNDSPAYGWDRFQPVAGIVDQQPPRPV
jgi:hypothetical protein